MRRYFKFFVGLILIPLTRMYLRKKRRYQHRGVTIDVFPTVFHPGLFGSTRFILRYLEKQNLKEKKILELGCGTALISIVAAKQGANVTASDLNPVAIDNAKSNSTLNNVRTNIIHSDLFDRIPRQTFDWIVINPPYYPKKIESEMDLAWNCGVGFEYFRKLFDQLPEYRNTNTNVIMILSEGCDIDRIQKIGEQASLSFKRIAEENAFFERRNIIFSIK